jgi:hypothetical protein
MTLWQTKPPYIIEITIIAALVIAIMALGMLS